VKKAAVAIPLIALLIGALLLWWNAAGTPRLAKRPSPTANGGPDAVPGPRVREKPPEEPAASPPEAQAGSLRIFVTAAASPLGGASVIVQREGVDDHRSFETPESGSRLIQGMPPGPYVVGVRHPGYLPGEARSEVAAGGTSEVRVELQKGGRIHGRVTDTGGTPLPNASVLLTDGKTKSPLGPSMGATSDARGLYELPPVSRGDYGLRFRHERFKVAERGDFTFFQGTETYEVNVALEVGARVTGRVLDEEGRPIEGARVMIGNLGSGGVTQSDRNGEFGMYGLTDAPVNASVSAPGHGTVIRRGIRPNTDGLEFRLPRPGTIAGRVEGGEIPEHFVVILSRHEEDVKQVLRVDTRYFTNPPGGIFVVPDVAPGVYWVEVEAQDFQSTDRPQVMVEAGKTSPELRMRFTRK